jgi:hypothetical protein
VAFHGYTNDHIQMTLYDAFSSIFNILVVATPHPLAQLFNEYMQKAQKRFDTNHQ